MNWLDIVIIVILVISAVAGLGAGLIKVLFTLVGGVVGIVLAGRFADTIGSKLTFISDEGTAKIVAFIVIVLVVMAVAAILAFVIKKIASAVLLGWVDRLGGAVIGLVIGLIVVGTILAMWVKFQGADIIADSAMANFLIDKFPLALALLPEDFDSVRNFFQ